MTEGFRRRRSDPLAAKFGRVMSDPAVRERCVALKVGDSTTADITEGFKVIVTRLEGSEFSIEELCMTNGNVTRVFSPDEALAFVMERGVVTMPITELAAAWGWPHCTQVYRALDRWVRGGLIERQGKVIRAHPSPPAQSADDLTTWIAERQGCHDRPRGGASPRPIETEEGRPADYRASNPLQARRRTGWRL
jgi:hypothetical protein